MKTEVSYDEVEDKIHIIWTLDDGRQSATYLSRAILNNPYYMTNFLQKVIDFSIKGK